MAIQCCYKCEERHVGCHSTCQRYLEEKAQWDIEREKIRQSQPATIHPSDFEMLACMHRQRKDNRRR